MLLNSTKNSLVAAGWNRQLLANWIATWKDFPKGTLYRKGLKLNVFIRDKISFVTVAHLTRGGCSCLWALYRFKRTWCDMIAWDSDNWWACRLAVRGQMRRLVYIWAEHCAETFKPDFRVNTTGLLTNAPNSPLDLEQDTPSLWIRDFWNKRLVCGRPGRLCGRTFRQEINILRELILRAGSWRAST